MNKSILSVIFFLLSFLSFGFFTFAYFGLDAFTANKMIKSQIIRGDYNFIDTLIQNDIKYQFDSSLLMEALRRNHSEEQITKLIQVGTKTKYRELVCENNLCNVETPLTFAIKYNYSQAIIDYLLEPSMDTLTLRKYPNSVLEYIYDRLNKNTTVECNTTESAPVYYHYNPNIFIVGNISDLTVIKNVLAGTPDNRYITIVPHNN
jgi:hypothetical protein